MQTHLKEMPQLVVLSIATIMISIGSEKVFLFRAFNFVLLMIFTFCLVFQSIYFVWNWINPNRGLTKIDGKMVQLGMDLSGIPIGVLSLIISLIVAIINLNINKKNTLKVERQLAIVTIITSSMIFIYFELI
jgi:hypothetical protein